MDRLRATRRSHLAITVGAISALLAAGSNPGLATPAVGRRIAPTPVATDRSGYAEPFLTVSPGVPQLLVGGANSQLGGAADVVSFRSSDGGTTWSERSMAVPGFGATYDPSAAFFSPQGVVFADTALQPEKPCWSGGSVAVFTSRNAGRTWSPPALIRDERGTPAFADKPMIAADPTTGDVYLAWSQASASETTNFCQPIPATNELLLAVSHDGGRTFGPPVKIAAPGFPTAFGAVMAVTPGGGLTVAFEASRRSVSPVQAAIFVADSTNGGKSFGRPVRVGPAVEPTTPPDVNLYATSWPSIAANPDGSIAIAWASGATSTRIYTVQRPSAGEHFSHPAVLNAPPGADIMPSLGPGPVLGFLAFFDGMERPLVTTGGPDGFGPLRAAAPQGAARSPYELGEYLGVQPVLGRVAMLWPQMHDGQQVVLFARTAVLAPAIPTASPATGSPSTSPPTRSTSSTHGPPASGPSSGGSVPLVIAAALTLLVLGGLAFARRGRGRHRKSGRR